MEYEFSVCSRARTSARLSSRIGLWIFGLLKGELL